MKFNWMALVMLVFSMAAFGQAGNKQEVWVSYGKQPCTTDGKKVTCPPDGRSFKATFYSWGITGNLAPNSIPAVAQHTVSKLIDGSSAVFLMSLLHTQTIPTVYISVFGTLPPPNTPGQDLLLQVTLTGVRITSDLSVADSLGMATQESISMFPKTVEYTLTPAGVDGPSTTVRY